MKHIIFNGGCKLENDRLLLAFPGGCRVGRFLRREKRFFVYAELDGEEVAVHTNNTANRTIPGGNAWRIYSRTHPPRPHKRANLHGMHHNTKCISRHAIRPTII